MAAVSADDSERELASKVAKEESNSAAAQGEPVGKSPSAEIQQGWGGGGVMFVKAASWLIDSVEKQIAERGK
jgi:hypothetical protein